MRGHCFYVEVWDTDTDSIITCSDYLTTMSEVVTFVEEQREEEVVLEGDVVKVYNVYHGADEQIHWDDLEVEYTIGGE